MNKISPMTGFDCGPLLSETTALPTEPQPLPFCTLIIYQLHCCLEFIPKITTKLQLSLKNNLYKNIQKIFFYSIGSHGALQ